MRRKLSGQPSQIRYGAQAAEFGEVTILRPAHNNKGVLNKVLRESAGRLTCKAWTKSDWFQANLSEEDLDKHTYILKRQMNKLNSMPNKAAAKSFSTPSRSATWFAVRPAGNNRKGLPGEWVQPDDILLGYAHVKRMKRDVSDTFLERVKNIGRLDTIYAQVTDINVAPEYQRKGLGIALLHGALQSIHDPKQPVVTSVLDAENQLIGKLTEVGFEKAEARMRNNLHGHREILETDLVIDSVQSLLGNLEERYPWLNEAEVIHWA